MEATAIIVAAGEGSRIGGAVAKPYLPIAGRPLILHTLDRFASARTIARIVLVVAADHLELCETMIREDPVSGALRWVLQPGGASRQESVSEGLGRVTTDCELVVIHDGVRPFVSGSLIDRCVNEAQEKGAVVVGLPARDTIKVVSETRKVQSTLERAALWEIQTPQAFHLELIVKAHRWARDNGIHATDDAALVERFGTSVYVLDGERTNIKVTVPEDLLFAEALIREGKIG
jgi:2-C-methyl-D-erythritol 4-phosphate cytidylyltransferase